MFISEIIFHIIHSKRLTFTSFVDEKSGNIATAKWAHRRHSI